VNSIRQAVSQSEEQGNFLLSVEQVCAQSLYDDFISTTHGLVHEGGAHGEFIVHFDIELRRCNRTTTNFVRAGLNAAAATTATSTRHKPVFPLSDVVHGVADAEVHRFIEARFQHNTAIDIGPTGFSAVQVGKVNVEGLVVTTA